MRIYKQFFKRISLTALLLTGFFAVGIAQDSTNTDDLETKAPLILTTNPTDGEINVDLGRVIEITFSSEMDTASINDTTLLLHATYADTMYEEHGDMLDDQINDSSAIRDSVNSGQHPTFAVSGTITYSNKIALFTPDTELKGGTLYTFTVTNGVKSSENINLDKDQSWSFTTIGISDSTYSDKLNNR